FDYIHRALREQAGSHCMQARRPETGSLVSADIPVISCHIFQTGIAVSIELISRRTNRGSASLKRPFVGRIHVAHVYVQSRRHRCNFGLRASANHHHRVADPILGMNTASRTDAENLTLSTKRLLDELNHLFRLSHCDVGCYRMESFADE